MAPEKALMKLEEAFKAAWKVEEECLEVIEEQNKQWKVPDTDLGSLKNYEEEVKKTFSGIFALSYLQWLMEDGVVEDTGDISDLEAVPGFKDK
jgi:hypothetical protein